MKPTSEWFPALALVSTFSATFIWSEVSTQVTINDFGNDTSGSAQCTRLIEVAVLGILNVVPAVANMTYPPTFSLHTRRNPRREILRVRPNGNVNSNFYDPKRDTKFIIHGFLGSRTNEWIEEMKNTLLDWDDVHVIVVDWFGAASVAYPQAAANTAIVGREIARLINALIDLYGGDLDHFHLIGHSLGSHVAGYAGAALPGLRRISGLDPAGPLFVEASKDRRLDPSDAKFVDVIHSDKECLGTRMAWGHIDFYPNGGAGQPGCAATSLAMRMENNIEGTLASLDASFCSHFRAVRFYIESIRNSPPKAPRENAVPYNPVCHFIGVLCKSFTDYLQGTCDDSVPENARTAIMGIDADTFPWQNSPDPPPMKYFLQTNDLKPYCNLHPAVNSRSDVINQEIAFEDAKIVSKEMLDEHEDLEGENANTNGGNTTSTSPDKSTTGDVEGEPREYEDSDSGAEQESMNELADGSDSEQDEADKGGDVTMKEEVMRHSDSETKPPKDTKHDFHAKGEAEKGSPITVTQNDLPSCADEQIIKLMKELRKINPEGAVVRAIESENSRLCRTYLYSPDHSWSTYLSVITQADDLGLQRIGLSSIEHFMATCDITKGEKSYSQLIHGVRSLNNKVCLEEVFRAEYLKYEDCYRGVGEDYRDCVGPAGWSEGNKEEYVCNEYIKVANCFYIKTAVRCSIHEARVVKDLVKEVVGSILSVQCKDIEKEPDVSTLMNGAASERCYPQEFLQLVFTLWSMQNLLPFLGRFKP